MIEEELTPEEMNDALGIEEVPEELEEELEEVEESDDPIMSLPEDDRKYAKGWTPDGDKTLEQFVSDGKWIEQIQDVKGKMSKMESDFQKRTKRLIELHEAQQENIKAELEQKFADAVNMSDLDEAKRIQAQLNDMDKVEEEAPDTSVLDEWNSKNPWIDEVSPKSAFAKQLFAQSAQEGMSFSDALAKVDAELEKHYPSQPEANKAPKTMPSRTLPGKKGAPAKIRWNDLTREEVTLFNQLGTWSKEEFLQTVQDNRGVNND